MVQSFFFNIFLSFSLALIYSFDIETESIGMRETAKGEIRFIRYFMESFSIATCDSLLRYGCQCDSFVLYFCVCRWKEGRKWGKMVTFYWFRGWKAYILTANGMNIYLQTKYNCILFVLFETNGRNQPFIRSNELNLKDLYEFIICEVLVSQSRGT